MVVPDFDVRGRVRCRAASEHDVFTRCLKKIVDDFEGPLRIVAAASADGLRVNTRTGYGDAVEIVEEGVDDGDVSHAPQSYTPCGLVLGGSVHPDPIEDKMIRGSFLLLSESQSGYGSSRLSARDLEADEAVVIGSGHESDRT